MIIIMIILIGHDDIIQELVYALNILIHFLKELPVVPVSSDEIIAKEGKIIWQFSNVEKVIIIPNFSKCP